MVRKVPSGLTIEPKQRERIQAIAERDGVSASAVMRRLIDLGLPLAEGNQTPNIARLITLIEFSSLALDTLIHRLSPADADPLLERAIAYARTYHAPEE